MHRDTQRSPCVYLTSSLRPVAADEELARETNFLTPSSYSGKWKSIGELGPFSPSQSITVGKAIHEIVSILSFRPKNSRRRDGGATVVVKIITPCKIVTPDKSNKSWDQKLKFHLTDLT